MEPPGVLVGLHHIPRFAYGRNANAPALRPRDGGRPKGYALEPAQAAAHVETKGKGWKMAEPEGMDQAAKDAYDAALNLIAETARADGAGISFATDACRALTHIPREISGIEALEFLDLDKTKVSDLSPLSGLTGLQDLHLSQTGVSHLSPLSGLTSLQRLFLDQTSVSDLSPLSSLTGLQRLSLNQTKVSDLSPLSGLIGLQALTLSQTGVSDLLPLSELTGLRFLTLNRIEVSDLSPLKGLTGLHTLALIQTGVRDLSPLFGLSGLQTLFLTNTKVSDLRPLIGLAKHGDSSLSELWFSGIPALQLDDNLARLADIVDHEHRTKAVLAYLKTLPPWPEPLPWLAKGEAQSRPQTQTTSKREEPRLARSPKGIKTTPAQVKFILSQPRLTQFTAREVAGQIRFALADVKRSTNALPEPLATIEEIADALDEVGNMQLAPKQKQRVEEFQLRIVHLEAVIEKLTHQLNEAEKARETADALAHGQSFSGRFNPAFAEESAKTIGFVARTGVVGGAIYFLGATNPIIAAMLGALAVMK